jgi:hypothetical protein
MFRSIRSPSPSRTTAEQLLGVLPANRADRVIWLERKCRAMRAQGLTGHWAYDLALHRNLLTVLKADRAALAATESLPASADRRRLRAG